MKKVIGIVCIIMLIVIGLCIYPFVEFERDGYLYMMSYARDEFESEDYKEIETDLSCYDESYFYNKDKDITVSTYEYKRFMFFKYFKVKIQKGNICDSEFILEESYIERFLNEATIEEGSDDVDLAKLIKGKKAIIENKRYPWNDNAYYIGYRLDNKYEEMYIYTNDEWLVVIQVGASDEGPKYIAYK